MSSASNLSMPVLYSVPGLATEAQAAIRAQTTSNLRGGIGPAWYMAVTPEYQCLRRRSPAQAAGGRGGWMPTRASAALTALRSSQASFFLLGSRSR